MCGIVGAIGQRNVTPILLEGLKRLEYRGYDSAGIVILNDALQRKRILGKVQGLHDALLHAPLVGEIGIAHTRWATHGVPSEENAHPHVSGDDIAVVHNGIIENHQFLRERLHAEGYHFTSQTDSEIIGHLINSYLKKGKGLLQAVQSMMTELHGAYALGIVYKPDPDTLIAVRSGSPLVIGLGMGENFIASDHLALLPVAQQFVYLAEGDVAEIRKDSYVIYDASGEKVHREVRKIELSHDVIDRGKYRHFMQKEIFEQPRAIEDTLSGRTTKTSILEASFGEQAKSIFDKTKRVQIVACGTSYHAGMVARYWLESIAKIPCQVEIASEQRYRDSVIEPNTLFVTISQSGETADTLAALRKAKKQQFLASLAICNVPESSLVRESDMVLMTRAGVEVGVASTKAFTTQLVSLLLLTIALGRRHGLTAEAESAIVNDLNRIPYFIDKALAIDQQIKVLAEKFIEKNHALFLGRGIEYPIAREGALKLKEISYIHAEAYPAGELKHGPLALVDKDMPVITVAPNDELLEKLKSNLQEVRARGGELIVFADETIDMQSEAGVQILKMPAIPLTISPIIYTIPLQLLAYHVAVLRGTDVDQPRNLAKSVTVE